MIYTEIRCNECGALGASRNKAYAHALRLELKGLGWLHREPGGIDLCPECRPFDGSISRNTKRIRRRK